MTHLKSLFGRLLPPFASVVILGTVAGYSAHAMTQGDCCHPGSPCCYPGSPCCHHGQGQGPSKTPAAPGAPAPDGK